MKTHRTILRSGIVCAVVLGVGLPAGADAVRIGPSRDTSIFEDAENSCGSGPLFAGQTGFFGLRRALLRFDIGAAVPAGSTINGAELSVFVNQSGLFASASDVFSLHRLTADWGEGTAVCATGTGVPAEPGDATWSYRFHDTVTWTTPGGDFVTSASATIAMPLLETATFGPTSQMAADVQAWLDAPASNFGWTILGAESQDRTARRMLSREEQEEIGDAPQLRVAFTPPPVTPHAALSRRCRSVTRHSAPLNLNPFGLRRPTAFQPDAGSAKLTLPVVPLTLSEPPPRVGSTDVTGGAERPLATSFRSFPGRSTSVFAGIGLPDPGGSVVLVVLVVTVTVGRQSSSTGLWRKTYSSSARLMRASVTF